MKFPGLHAQRCGDVIESGRHLGLVHVDADADDGVVDAVGLGVHFRQDAAKFACAAAFGGARDHQIVGPANVGNGGQFFGGGIARRPGRRPELSSGACAGEIGGPQQNAAIDAGGFFRHPGTARAALARGLLFGQHDGAVRLARFAELHGDAIGRVDFEKMIDAASEGGAVEPMAQHLRGQNVRDASRCDSRCAGGPSRARPARAAFRSSARPAGA